MAETKENRNKVVLYLINKGMSYSKIAKLFGISKTAVNSIDKRFNSVVLKKMVRECVLCNTTRGLIDDEPITICKNCLNKIEKLK